MFHVEGLPAHPWPPVLNPPCSPHRQSPQNIEKFTIRTVNNDGRLGARDLAVVTAKRLFLKRNLPVVCRRLVAEQARLNSGGGEPGTEVAGRLSKEKR